MSVSYDQIKDPMFFKENVVPAHADFIAYESVKDFRADRRSLYLSLNGEWKFAYAENWELADHHYYEKGTDYSTFSSILVPGHMQMQGYGKPQYANVQYPWDGLEEIEPGELPTRSNPIGMYVKTFELPSDWNGQSVFIAFQGVESGMILYCNGTYVGYSEDSFTPSDFELTPFLTEGENTLAVTVLKFTSGSWTEDQDFYRFSGIYRDVTLYTRPAAYVSDYTVRTHLSDDFSKADVSVSMKGSFSSVKIALMQKEQCIGCIEEAKGDNESEKTLSVSVENPILWSAENPYLYQLIIYVQDGKGKVTEVIPQVVGIRRIEIKDATILLNGKRLEIKGVNRHDFSDLHGRAITAEETLTDIVNMKRNNINAIRTSHYPDSTPLYHMADEYGIYIMDENNMETHGCWDVVERGMKEKDYALPGDKNEWAPSLLDRVNSVYQRDKNHPSVLFWSLGNESYGGSVIYEMSKLIKKLDPDRPVHYEGVTHDPRFPDTTDIESQMYTPVEKLRCFLKENRKKPFILCEYLHAMGNSCGALDLYVQLMEEEPIFQGGFIWDYIDQSIQKKNRYGEIFEAYGGDFGERPTDYEFSCNGLCVGMNRKPSPKMQTVKYNYRNIKVTFSGEKVPTEVCVRNNNLFVDTSGYDVVFTIKKNGLVMETRKMFMAIPPQTLQRFPLQNLPTEPGEYVLTLSFHEKSDTIWCDAGYEVAFGETVYEVEDSAESILPSALLPCEKVLQNRVFAGLKPFKAEKPEVVRGKFNLGVRGKKFTALFSGTFGGLSSYVYEGREMIQSIPKPNFYRAPLNNDEGSLMPQRYAQWKIASEYNTYLDMDENGVRLWNTPENPSVEETDYSVKVHIVYHMPTKPKADCKLTYEVFGDGTILTSLTYDPVIELGDMPAFGVIFKTDADYDHISWYGLGPEETYADRKSGAKLSTYSQLVSEAMAPYVVPQECGNKTDVRYAKVTDAKGHGLLFTGDSMYISALPYTPQELEAARHPFELPPVHYTVIRVSLAQMGVGGDDSWGAQTLPQYLLDTSKPLSFSFAMRGI